MKLKRFEKFITENQDPDINPMADLIRLGLANLSELIDIPGTKETIARLIDEIPELATQTFDLPIGGEGDLPDDDDPHFSHRIAGDLAALNWLGFPKEIIHFDFHTNSYKSHQESIEALGEIGKTLIPRYDPNQGIYFHTLNLKSATPLYKYMHSYDWGEYVGIQVNGKPVVVLDAPDGPYIWFRPEDFNEISLPDLKLWVLNNG